MYLYAKSSRINKTPGLKEFLTEIVSTDAIGIEDGYLQDKGLVPLSEEELEILQDKVLTTINN